VKEKITLSLLVTLATLFRVYLILRDSVPFPYDMGRDLLWTKDIAFYHTPTLIGPAASIWGVYFQPFWYYFLSIPLLLTGGNPLSAVYTTAATVLLTGVLAFSLFRKYLSKTYIVTLTVLLLFSSNLINISTFAFHANQLPILMLLATYFIYLSKIKSPLYLPLAFLSASLMFSADPAPAVAFTLVPILAFSYFRLYKGQKALATFIASAAAFTLPFLPQILFELRNGLVQTKSLVAYFAGSNPSLSGQLPILERIPNRFFVYFDFFKISFAPQKFTAIILLAITLVGLYRFIKNNGNKNLSILFKINLSIFIITFLINTFLVTVEIKSWYLYGLTVNAAFLIVFALIGIKSKLITFIFLALFLIANLLPFAKMERLQKAKADPATLNNQLKAIDLIYKDATTPFSVYVYTPSIYDLNYQYLFWWQGIKNKKGLPSDFVYLPQKPNYVRNKSKYSASPKLENTIYLIVENAPENEFYTSVDWQTNFNNYKIVWEKNISGAIKIQKRLK